MASRRMVSSRICSQARCSARLLARISTNSKEASAGRSMQMLGANTTGPAWLLPMASTIPLRTPTGRAMRLSSSSYSLLQRKWLRTWCARPRLGRSPSPKAEPSEVYQQAGRRWMPG